MRAPLLIDALLVGTGGFVGSILRWACSSLIHRTFPLARMPWGTLTVNVLGCLLIGVLAGLTETRQIFGPRARLFMAVGLLGGFTTFSTFGYETMNLIETGDRMRAGLSVALQVVVGVGAAGLGYHLSRMG